MIILLHERGKKQQQRKDKKANEEMVKKEYPKTAVPKKRGRVSIRMKG